MTENCTARDRDNERKLLSTEGQASGNMESKIDTVYKLIKGNKG